MAITNKFIHFNAKAKFVERFATETDDFKNKYTIFIKDTKQIWAHGGMYGGYYEFASGIDGSFTVTKPKVGIEAGTETVKITIGEPNNARHADSADNATHADTATNANFATNAGHADTADRTTLADTANNATSAETANRAHVANKVVANLTITNGSNSVTYDGSEAKSITITSGTNYELTADKMSAAWGTNTVSGESLSVTSISSKNMTNDCDFTINGSSIELINEASTDAGVKIDVAASSSAGATGYEHTGVCTGSNSKIAVSSSTLPDFANLATYMDASGVFTGGRMNAAGGFFQTSDARKKDFGSNVEIDFNALKSIPKKYFEWKDNPEAGQQIGTSAQDLLRVYPSLVNKDKNGYYSVDYARLSIVALAAIDKLNNKIEELENKIESLERR